MRSVVVAALVAVAIGCSDNKEQATPAPDPCLYKCYVKPGTSVCPDRSLGTNGRCVPVQLNALTDCTWKYDCPPEVKCVAGSDCPGGQECDAPPGCGSPGTCRYAGSDCDLSHPPVCGCDGKTYYNTCLARKAGTKVDHEGECLPAMPTACGGTSGAMCPAGSFCRLPDGSCSTDAVGTCMTIPSGCPDIYAPVCGCDKTSYKNVCLAWTAMQNFSEWANCPAP